jgi:hypothetical protein
MAVRPRGHGGAALSSGSSAKIASVHVWLHEQIAGARSTAIG